MNFLYNSTVQTQKDVLNSLHSALLYAYTTLMNHFHNGLTHKLTNEMFYLISCSKQDIPAC